MRRLKVYRSLTEPSSLDKIICNRLELLGINALLAAKIFDSQLLLHCLRPCQQNVYVHANRSFARLSHVLFVFVLLVPGFLTTSTLYYIESQKPC